MPLIGMYILQTALCFLASNLEEFYESLRSIVSSVTNIKLTEKDSVWLQASLPVWFSSLGIQSTVQFASSAFLASAAAWCDLVNHILPGNLQFLCEPILDDALSYWSQSHEESPGYL